MFILLTCSILSSCNFNFNDSPGPQLSSSIHEAQSNGTFICAYKVKGNYINGIGIKAIFAEKQYWRDEGLFLKKTINRCTSQLIIVSNDNEPFTIGQAGYDVDWKVIGFECPGSLVIYRKYKGTLFPDSISIKVVAIRGKNANKVVENLTLSKVR